MHVYSGVVFRLRHQHVKVWDFILRLDSLGWNHRVHAKSTEDPPYNPIHQGQKIWYSQPGDESIPWSYLAVLFKGGLEVLLHQLSERKVAEQISV